MTAAKLVRRYLWDTQTKLVLCGVISSLFGFIFGVIGDSAPILFFSYLIGVGYMSLTTLDIQDTYMSMYNSMPISGKTIVRAHFNYYFAFCSILGSIFVVLLVLYSLLVQRFSLSLFIGMLVLTLCMTLFFGNIMFWLHYRFQKAAGLFLAIIILSFLFGGYLKVFDFLQGISFTTASIAALSIISLALLSLTKFQIRYSVTLFQRKDFT
ncbi:ABC-2 transporter permease [Lysinibacillus sp. 54212]|uniref:ABC-2 transporter permease n=1 Tax=Lysinibacillus sp. 54212 TaxID=3119829 RepID=UPI002FC59458